jgi:hypothetical protein
LGVNSEANLSLDDLGLGSLRGLGGGRRGGRRNRRGGGSDRRSNRGRHLDLGGLGGLGRRRLLGGRRVARRAAALSLNHGLLVGGRGVGLLELSANIRDVGVPGLLALRRDIVALALTARLLVTLGRLLKVLGDLLRGRLEGLLDGVDRRLEGAELLTELLELGGGRGGGDGGGRGGGVSGGHLFLYSCGRRALDRFFRASGCRAGQFLDTRPLPPAPAANTLPGPAAPRHIP